MNKEQTTIQGIEHKTNKDYFADCINKYIASFEKSINETNNNTEKYKTKNDIVSLICHMNIKSKISDENKKMYLKRLDDILPPIESKYIF